MTLLDPLFLAAALSTNKLLWKLIFLVLFWNFLVVCLGS